MPGAVGEIGVVVETLAGLGVEALEIRQPVGVFADVVEVGDQASELRAPVADVVLPDDRVAERFENSCDGVADDRAAQVVDLHLLGEVGVRVVDDHALAGLGIDGGSRQRLGE